MISKIGLVLEHRLERLEVLLPLEMAKILRRAVESGEYASAGEVVRDALRLWMRERGSREDSLNKSSEER